MGVDFFPTDPAFLADPFPIFRRLRDEDPIHWSGRLGGWVLTRHDDAKAALADARFSAERIAAFMKGIGEAERDAARGLGESLGHWAVFSDPPRHTRLRGLMNKAFTPQAVERLRPRIESIVSALIDAAEPRGAMDFVADFACPLPVAVIAEMMGVPLDRADRLRHWSDELALFVGSAVGAPDRRERAARAMAELDAFFRRLIEERRAAPREDLVSSMIAARDRGDLLGEEELTASCVMLLFAGHETTTNLLANGLLALLREPAQMDLLRREPDLMKPAVEELLRFDGPVQAMVRVAREGAELRGRRLKPGERIFAMINAANRDPEAFAEPDRLDLARKENPHIAFGAGIHYCLGAPLARLEAQAAFAALLRRLPRLRLAAGPIEWRETLVMRGPKSLPVRF